MVQPMQNDNSKDIQRMLAVMEATDRARKATVQDTLKAILVEALRAATKRDINSSDQLKGCRLPLEPRKGKGWNLRDRFPLKV